AGDSETGVSIMRMDAGLDTGPLFAQRALTIGADDDTGTLHDKLAELGAQTLLEVLANIANDRADAAPQAADGATYARKIEKSETWLRWEHPAPALERAVRAVRPAPGGRERLAGEPSEIWRGRAVAGRVPPGGG